MRIAAVRQPDGSRALVEIDDVDLRPVRYDTTSGEWRRLEQRLSPADSACLGPPFPPRAVIAPGPRLDGPPDWRERHREFHVKPVSVVAAARSAVRRPSASIAWRLQAGLVFRSTPRFTGPARILDRLIGCHLVAELIDIDALRVDWEGPRWHLRFGEGMSFDGACPMSELLATPDEFPDGGIVVDHAAGPSVLAWPVLADFAALVNRYLELDERLLLLAGSEAGPVLRQTDDGPQLSFERTAGASARAGIWGSNDALGRVDCSFAGST